jgi:hypothetical protein
VETVAMTTRERWTVYPLLFLAIGLAVRSVAVPQGEFAAADVGDLRATRLVCREILVEGEDRTILVHMGRVVGGGGGRVEFKDRNGVDTISVGTRPESRDGVVEFFDADGEPAGELSAPAPRTAATPAVPPGR